MWNCDQCSADRGLHRRRGRCHGPFDATLEGADLDADGLVVIRGDSVVGGARDPFGSAEWRRCPVAAARQPEVRDLFDQYRALRDGRAEPIPLTAGAADALEAAATNEAALRAWQAKRARIEAGGAA